MTTTKPHLPISESSEDTERPVVGITPFDWRRDYQGTYDACPSAFWLAPDANDALPAPNLVTPRSDPVADAPAGPRRRERVDARSAGIAAAIIAAGPIFVALGVLGSMNQSGSLAAILLMLFPPVIVVGVLLSVVPVSLGSWAMGLLGERIPLCRRLAAWMLAGAGLGGIIGGIASHTPLGVAWMAATGAACAAIARWKVRWTLPDQLAPLRNVATPAVAISACPAK